MQDPFADLIPGAAGQTAAPVIVGTPRPSRPPAQTQTQAEIERERLRAQKLQNQKLERELGMSSDTGPTVGDMTLTGEDYLKTVPQNLATQARLLSDGRLPISPKALTSPQYQRLLQVTTQYDPTFDAINYGTRLNARKDMTAGVAGRNRRALNTAIGHLGHLYEQIGGTASHGGFPLATTVNTIQNAYNRSSGDPGITQYEQTATALSSELTQVFRGSGGAEADVKRYLEELDSSHSKAQKEAAVKNIAALLRSRLDALGEQYDQSMGKSSDPFQLLDEHAQLIMQSFEGGGGPAAPPSGGPAARPPGGRGDPSSLSGTMPLSPPTPTDYRSDVGVFGNARSDPEPIKMSPEQEASWNHSLSEMQTAFDNPKTTRDQLIVRAKELGVPIDAQWLSNLDHALSERAKGRHVQWVKDPRSLAPPPPDISDVRGDRASTGPSTFGAASGTPIGAIVQGAETLFGREKVSAFGNGVLDVPTLGNRDELAAGVRTVFNGGTMKDNLARERAIDDYDSEHNFGARLSGQLVGGAVLPMGEVTTIGNLALKGGAYGFAYGFGSGRGGVGDRLESGAMGGGAGAGGSALIGAAAPLAGKAFSALGRRMFGEAPPEAANVLAAGKRQEVPVNAADVRPGTRNVFAALESMPGSSGPINRSVTAGREAMAERVGGLAAGGTALDETLAGETVQNAGRRLIATTKRIANRQYDSARALSGDAAVPATEASATLDAHIARLAETPESNKELLSLLSGLKQDLSKPLTIDALRDLRTAMRTQIGTRNLTSSNADRIVGDVMDGASRDIAAGLSSNPAALKAFQVGDEFYRRRQTYINDVLSRFLGPKDRPMSAEQTMQALRRMASPKGDSRRFAEMMQSLDKGERGDIVATFAEQIGRHSAEEPFSPALFLSSVRKLSGAARRTLFGEEGAAALEDLTTLAVAKQGTIGRLNNSSSGRVMNYRQMIRNILGGGAGGGAGVFAVAGGSPATGAIAGTAAAGAGLAFNRALAKAFTNAKFVRLLAQAPATTSPRAIDAHIGRLRQLAARDPNVRGAVEAIERSLLNAVNDNAPRIGSVAASPDERPDDQQ